METLSKWIKKEELKGKLADNFFENKFEAYLALTLSKCENINILILQNQQINIKDIYYPLNINSTKDHSSYKIYNDSIKPIFDKYQRILISDTAGMGKSTLSKWVCLNSMKNTTAIPILIELRNLTESHSILDEIFSQIDPISKDFDKELILKFLETGSFLIVLDGFDEIQIKNQELIIKNIREFINKVPNNWYMLTSRPEGALASFGDFQQFNIKPLQDTESYELIGKYNNIHPVKIGDRLIEDIKEKYVQVKELLENPFLVSLLYSTYTYNKDIPATKSSFYDEIYSALFKKHDLSKDGWSRSKKSKLEFQQFRTILRQLAFDTAIEGIVNYTEVELINWIKESKDKCPGIEVNETYFLDDILSSVPLFQRDGSKIKWSHKSLQDFFAAEYIVYDSTKELLLKEIYENNVDTFQNILDFISEIDFKTFRKVLVKKLLEDFIEYSESSYSSKKFKNIDLLCLKERQMRTFGSFYQFKDRVKTHKFLQDDRLQKIERNGIEYSLKHITVGPSEGVICYSNIRTTIISILAKMNCDYIDYYKQSEYKGISLGESYEVDLNDDPNNILNSEQNFKIINTLLTGNELIVGNKKGCPKINIELATIELNKIKKEIEQEQEFQRFKLFKKK